MSDALLELIRSAASSPWLYVALFVFAVIDGFFPPIPGETAVVTAGVLAATAEPSIPVVVTVAAVGAFTGDHVSYLIGRTAGSGLLSRMKADSRRRAPFDWAARTLDRRGGLVLVATRYVPAVRTAATMTAGAVGYPLRFFSRFDVVAASFWATGWALVGYVGGATFRDDPLKGLLLGLGLALTITVLVEAVHRLLPRLRRR